MEGEGEGLLEEELLLVDLWGVHEEKHTKYMDSGDSLKVKSIFVLSKTIYFESSL